MIEYVHPEDRAFVAAQRDRRSRGEDVPAFEARFQRAGGEVSWVEINGVVIDWDGAPANLFFLKDTTERHALHESLKSALAQREAILETTTVGVCFLVNRRHQWVNRTFARMLGYEAIELLGKETRVHFARTEDGERSVPPPTALAVGTPFRRAPDEAQGRVAVLVQIVGNAVDRGTSRGSVWTYVDVTERKRAELEIGDTLARERELGELKSRLLSMTSHEFRTPLATILSSAELLGHYGDRIGPDEQRSIMDDLVAAARRMQLMLEDMLTLGQAEAGRLDFKPQPVDVDALCRQVVAEVRSARAGDHELELELATAGVRRVDGRLVHHILGNLLTNACKYSPAGSRVTMRLQAQEAALQVDVIDDVDRDRRPGRRTSPPRSGANSIS